MHTTSKYLSKFHSKNKGKVINIGTYDSHLMELFEDHLKQTHEQVIWLAKVFKGIDKKPVTTTCDAGIDAAAQKIEHSDIDAYETLRKFAETHVLLEAEKLLLEFQNEEKETEQILTDVAVLYGVNMEAAAKQA
jgi:ferritin-like metal-binding protein YciE